MLQVKDISKIYELGNTQVISLDKVSLKVNKGDLISVVGPSGSGKSTLLYTIGGLLTPTHGSITIGETSIYELNSRERAKYRRRKLGLYLSNIRTASVPDSVRKRDASTAFSRRTLGRAGRCRF